MFIFCKYKIQCYLETGGDITKTERHARTLENPSVTHERRFIAILRAYLHLPKRGIGIERREVFRVAESIDSLVHS